MAAGDIKKAFIASSDLTVTNLHSLASSAAYNAGWESATIDHSSDLALDDRLTFRFATHASNRQAGAIRIYLFQPLDDTPTWPDTMDGTESAETWTDEEERDSACILAKEITVDNTASAIYDTIVPSVAAVFGGNMPQKYGIYISGNATTTTTAQFAASGSQVTVKSSYKTVAQ